METVSIDRRPARWKSSVRRIAAPRATWRSDDSGGFERELPNVSSSRRYRPKSSTRQITATPSYVHATIRNSYLRQIMTNKARLIVSTVISRSSARVRSRVLQIILTRCLMSLAITLKIPKVLPVSVDGGPGDPFNAATLETSLNAERPAKECSWGQVQVQTICFCSLEVNMDQRQSVRFSTHAVN